MRLTLVIAMSVVVAMAAGSRAQTQTAAAAGTKLSGTMNCPKTDPVAVSQVGDDAGHSFALMKVKCTWTAGDIGGAKMQSEEDTFVGEMAGTSSKDAGYGVTTLAGGDKAYVKFQGTTTYKGTTPVSGQGSWTFSGGTGKAKGLKGKGTYKGTFKPDGSVTWTVDGEYLIGK